MKSEYDIQAEKFLKKTGTKFECQFLYHGPYFDDETEKRDVYEITLTRGKREYKFKFGQSIMDSMDESKGKLIFIFNIPKKRENELLRKGYKRTGNYLQKKAIPPTAYDVLAAITKYDPGTFEDFCLEYGYNEDSKKAEKVYFAVQKEYQNVQKLFGDCLDELAEIN